MAVKLRLMRMGKKKQPTYRVVAADTRSPRDGRFIEVIGTYNPRLEPSLIEIDNEKALHWLRNGAKPSERVQKLLTISGAWSDFTGEPKPAPYVVAETPKEEPVKETAEASAEAKSDDDAEDKAETADEAGSEEE